MTKGQIAVTFMDDSERFFPVPEGSGWRVRTEYGAPTLVIGRGVPRVEIPLANVRYYEVSPLPSRPSRGPLASIAEAVAAGRCPGCDRPFDAPGVSCHESAGGGWVCSRSVEAAPDPAEVEDVVRWAEQQARRCGFVWFEDELPQRCEKEAGHDGAHERRRCPARAWLKGTSYSCETPASYPHTEHGNATAGLMWSERTS